MKKIIFTLSLIIIVAQSTFAWSWPSTRNYNGSSPEQPTTLYLGDQGTFGHDSWADVDTKWPKWQIFIHTSSDINNGTASAWTAYSNIQHKTALSPRFTSVGTWYWGMKVEYTDAGGTTGWYCRNDANWYSMWGSPTSNLTITVSALSDPTSQTATAASITQISLSWAKWNSKNVMIVRRLTSDGASNAPTQGSAYTVGNTLGTGTVVYNSGGTSFNDTGLTPGTSYTYTFYSENYSYYSPGATASASTTSQTSAATDYFRSKTTGNWNTAGTWESSPNNTNWITSTLVPDGSSAAITIQSGHTVTLVADATAKALTISGYLVCSSNTLNISTAGTFTNNGTFYYGTGSVAFAGSATITGTIGFNNVTLAGGVTFSSASTINGTLQLNAGGYVNTTAPIYASGSILKYNSGTTYGRGTEWSTTSSAGYPYHVQISNNTTINMGANSGTGTARQCAGNLTVDAGSTFSMNEIGNLMTAAVTVMGNVVNNGNITLSGSSGGDLKSQGNINDNGTFNANSRAVFFNGSATQVIQGTGTFDISYVRINKTGGSVQLATNLTCAGPGGGNAMEIDGTSSILDLNGYTLYLGQASVASTYNNGIATPGSIKGSSTSNITILGNGAFGTLNFTAGSQTLNNLSIDRQTSGTITLGTSLTLSGQLILTNGTFTNSTNLILGDGATIVRSAGTLSAAPTFGSSVNLTYSGTATKGNEFPATDIINTLTANNTGGISLTDNRNIPNLSIGSGSSLTVNAGKQLTVSTSMSNSGTLNLLSDATGTATITTPATITNSSATYNVSQYLTSNRNWYISSPVSTATSNVIKATLGNKLWDYNEANSGTVIWNEITATDVNLDIMKGYVANVVGTITFSGGNLNTSTESISNLSYAGTISKGFNLVGNPYPSYVNWNNALRTNVSSTIWYRSKRTGVYNFQTYNSSGGIGTLTGTSLIPPMQAFWVKVNSATNSLSFNNTMRSHQDQSYDSIRLKAPAQKNTEQQIVRLQVSNGTNSDEAVVLYNANASNGYDDYDSPKMTNNDDAIPEIYTIAGSEQVVINGLNSVTLDEQMPLGFTTGSTNTFTIKATELTNFDSDKRLILLDTQENTYQDLTFGSVYTFSSTPTTSNTRFKIVFKSAGVIAGVDKNANNSVIISTNENKQILINRGTELNNDGIVTVYNAVGQKLVSSTLSNSHNILSKPFNAGVYVVSVNIAGINTTKKVIIK